MNSIFYRNPDLNNYIYDIVDFIENNFPKDKSKDDFISWLNDLPKIYNNHLIISELLIMIKRLLETIKYNNENH